MYAVIKNNLQNLSWIREVGPWIPRTGEFIEHNDRLWEVRRVVWKEGLEGVEIYVQPADKE